MGAYIAMAGMNPVVWMTTSDNLLRGLMERIANRRNELAANERQDLAGRIINLLGKSIKG